MDSWVQPVKNSGKMSRRASHQEGKHNLKKPRGEPFRQRPLNDQLKWDLEWRKCLDRKRHLLHLRQPGGNTNIGKNASSGENDINGKNDKIGTDGKNGGLANQSIGVSVAKKHYRMSCTRRRRTTEHLTVRITDAHLFCARNNPSTHLRWLRKSWSFESAFLKNHLHRNLLGLSDPPPPLSYHAGYGIRHNLCRSMEWFIVWPNGWAESHYRLWAQRPGRDLQRVHTNKSRFQEEQLHHRH